MERFSLTCKVLYNNDLLNKTEEIKNNTPPKVIYNSLEEYETLEDKAIQICKEGITKMINTDNEYFFMRNFGINPGQYDDIRVILCDAFNTLTKGQANEWVNNYACIVNLTIYHTIVSLTESNVWYNVFDDLGKDGLINYLTNILKHTIVNGICNNNFKYSKKICYFKCIRCKEIVDFVSCKNLCETCIIKNLYENKLNNIFIK